MADGGMINVLGLDIETDGLVKGKTEAGQMASNMDTLATSATKAEKAIEETSAASSDFARKGSAVDDLLKQISANVAAMSSQMGVLVNETRQYNSTAQSMVTAIGGVSSSIDGLASNYGKIPPATDKATSAQEAFLRSLKETADTLGYTRTQLLEYRAAQLGVTSQAAPDIQRINSFETGLKGVKNTAGLTSYELLNLGNQFQDFGVQVASGGGFFRPLIQQGSQILGVFQMAEARGISFGTALKSIGGSAAGLLGVLAPVLAVVAAVGGAFALADREMMKGLDSKKLLSDLDLTEKQLDRLKKKGTDLGITLGDSLNGFGKTLVDTLKSAVDEGLKALGTSTGDIGKRIGQTLDGVASILWTYVKDWYAIVATVGDFVVEAFTSVYNAFEPILGPIVKAAQDLFGKVTGAAGKAFKSIPDMMNSAATTLIGIFGGLARAIPAALSNMPKLIVDVFVTAFNAAGKAITDFINKNRDLINTFLGAAGAVLNIPIPKIPELDFKPIVNGAQGAMTEVADAYDKGSAEAVARFNKHQKGIDDAGKKFIDDWEKNTADAYGKRIKKAAGDPEKTPKTRTDSGVSEFLHQIDEMKREQEAIRDAMSKGIGDVDAEKAALGYLDQQVVKLTTSYEAYKKAKASGDVTGWKHELDVLKQTEDEVKKYYAAVDRRDEMLNDAAERQKILMDAYTQGGKEAYDLTAAQFELVDKNKDLYAPIVEATGKIKSFQEDTTKAALEAAAADAKRLVTSRQIAASDQVRLAIDRQIADQAKLKTAAAGGYDNFEQMKIALDLMSTNKDLTEAAALAEAKRLQILQRESDELQKQADRMKYLTERASSDRSADAFQSAVDKFWDDFVSGSPEALKDVGRSLKSIFQQSAADGLKAGFDPVLQWLKEKMSSVFSSVFSSAKGAIEGALEKIGILKKGENGQYTINSSSQAGQIVQQAGTAFAGYSTGQTLLQATGLNGKSPQQQQNSQIGSAVGAIAGSFLGPIGSAIGSAIGGFIGGLIGPKGTDATAGANLTRSGDMSGSIMGSKRTDATTSALNSAISAIQSGYTALTDLGGKMGVYVTGLNIGQRDRSNANISNGTTVSGNVGDAADLANNALVSVLRNTTFASDALNKIKDGMLNAGSSFDDTYKVLQQVDGVMKSVQPALSQWGQQLKTLKDTFDPLIATTGAYTSALQDAYNTAKGALASAFDTDVSKQLLSAQSSVAGQYASMLETQAQRLKDATDIGGNMANVLALNAQEMTNFVNGLQNSYSSVTDLNKAFDLLVTQAKAAGQSTAALETARQTGLGTMRDNFNSSTSDSLLQASNSTLYNLEQMLKTQKQRISDATALGANIAAVDRLNAIETSNFFKNLSDTEKKQLGDYLGLIEDYTGKIGVVGSQLLDALDPLTTGLTDQIKTLNDTASAYQSLAKTVGDTKASIEDKYSNVVPMTRITDLRQQFKDTSAKALTGDQDAMGAVSDLANKLIDMSRQYFGSSQTFKSDYDLVTSMLGQVQDAAGAQSKKALDQVSALNAQVDLLTEIKDILGSSDPQLTTLANDFAKLSADTGDVKTLLGQYLGLQASQQAQSLSDAQLQALSMIIGSNVANDNAIAQASAAANATTGANTSSSTSGTGATSQAIASGTDAAQVAGYFQLLYTAVTNGDASAQTTLNLLLTEFRKISLFLQQQTAA